MTIFKPGDKIRAIRAAAFTPCYKKGDEFVVFTPQYGEAAIHCHWSDDPHYLIADTARDFELCSKGVRDRKG